MFAISLRCELETLQKYFISGEGLPIPASEVLIADVGLYDHWGPEFKNTDVIWSGNLDRSFRYMVKIHSYDPIDLEVLH